MRSQSRPLVATLGLILLPIVLVFGLRKAGVGPSISGPEARQKGPRNAKAVIVEYSDFQCPVCARVQPSVDDLLKAYDGKVRIVFKHFPLQSIHPNALSAARAAECAAEQNQFWPYADSLYKNQPLWAGLQEPTTHYVQFASDVKIDLEAFKACYADERSLRHVLADVAEGRAAGINSTPTFFIGEDEVVGAVFMADGARMIEKALRQ